VLAGPVAVRDSSNGGGRALDANGQKCRRLDEKRPPAQSWQNLAQRRQQDAIGHLKEWASNLAPQHLQLMPKNKDLHLPRSLVAADENQQLKPTANGPIQKSQHQGQQ
jgi:hypothetical protein